MVYTNKVFKVDLRQRLNQVFKIGLIVLAVIFLLSPRAASALTKEQTTVVSQNCSNIRQSLQNLQKIDSRTRVFLGTVYETVLTDFITPLNLRLTRNNQPDATLTEIQADFATTRGKFIQDFTDYMKELETLTLADCAEKPEDFYEQLEVVREHRKVVNKDVRKLNLLIVEQINTVAELRESL